MDVGVPRALVRVLYDCVCEDLVLQLSVVTNTAHQKHLKSPSLHSWETVLGGWCSTGGLFLQVPGVKVVQVCVFCAWRLLLLHLDQRSHSLLGSFPRPPSPLLSGRGEPLLWAGPGGKRNTAVGQRVPLDVHGVPVRSSCRGNRCLHWLLLEKNKK